MTSSKRSDLTNILGIMLVFTMCQAAMIISPALADIEKAYSNVSHSNILLISTIPQLLGIPAALITGKVAGKKVKYKTLAMIAAAGTMIGGALPFFIRSFPVIVISRVIFGFSYNMALPLSSALPLLYFEKQRAANIMGYGACVKGLVGTILQYLAGVVCAINVHLTWIVHLFFALPLVGLAFLLPEPEKQEKLDTAPVASDEPKKKVKLNYLPFIMFGLLDCVFYPIILNMSSIVIGEGLGTSATAGTIISAYTLGSMFGGFFFGTVYKFCKNFTIPVLLVCFAISLACGFFGQTMLILIIGCAFGGVAFACFGPALMMRARATLPAEAVSPASGAMNACLKVGAFLSAYYAGAVGKVFGNLDPRFPLLIGLIVVVAITIPWTVILAKDTFSKKNA